MSQSDNNILSVTQLTARIKQMLEQGFAHVEVSGEISRLTRPASGHIYFTIKDAHAAISAVVWRSAAMRLKTIPKEGEEFIFSGHLSLYEPRGSYQLIVTRIEAAGAGKLAAEFERRKAAFAERGWFDPEHKLPLPILPDHIGIVTSSTAAAYEDVRKVLNTRPAYLSLTLSPAIVQGSRAPESIARAINALSTLDTPPDVILLVRGGGSIEDLWCFNDERVVRAIYDCTIPIISGIGHEIDTTLADYSADQRAATPSNAAELSSPSSEELRKRLPRLPALATLLNQRLKRIHRDLQVTNSRATSAWHRYADARLHKSSQTISRLHHAAEINMSRLRSPLRSVEKRLAPLQPGERLQKQRREWSNTDIVLQQQMHHFLKQQKEILFRSLDKLQAGSAHLIAQRSHCFELLNSKLTELDPTSVLKRGYSLNYDADGKLITSAAELAKGDRLHIHFHDGSAESEIKQVKENNS